jgi:hypothetical protein
MRNLSLYFSARISEGSLKHDAVLGVEMEYNLITRLDASRRSRRINRTELRKVNNIDSVLTVASGRL